MTGNWGNRPRGQRQQKVTEDLSGWLESSPGPVRQRRGLTEMSDYLRSILLNLGVIFPFPSLIVVRKPFYWKGIIVMNPFEEWESRRAVPDEIMHREPTTRQFEVRDGRTRTMETLTFADGSKLTISAEVPLPPTMELTPARIKYLRMTGERGERLDDGSSEAMSLARQSSAFSLIERLCALLDEVPVCEKVPCPTCQGEGRCCLCGGRGCDECLGGGACPDCRGRGSVAGPRTG